METQLDRIERLLMEQKLGFSSGTQRIPIYCNRSKGGLWYTLERNGDDMVPTTIEGDRLTCYLEGLIIKSVTRKKKGDCDKLRLYVKGDRPYVLESGWSTLPREQSFAKAIIWTIAHMTKAQIQNPIVLNPHPGNEDGVLFCKIFQGKKSLYFERNEEPDWDAILEMAIVNLETATGRSFREKTEDPEPQESSTGNFTEAQAIEGIGVMDMFNRQLAATTSIKDCRLFCQWVKTPAVWKQISEVPAAASFAQQKLREAISTHAPADLRDVQMDIAIQVDRLGWDEAQVQQFVKNKYGKGGRSELDAAEHFLFLWHLEGQQQLSLQGV
jgi:hypothetical protein